MQSPQKLLAVIKKRSGLARINNFPWFTYTTKICFKRHEWGGFQPNALLLAFIPLL